MHWVAAQKVLLARWKGSSRHEGSVASYVRMAETREETSPSPCFLQEYHGTFIEPISTTYTLVPIIGETKLLLNSDIVIPLSAYFSDTFGGGDYSNANTESKNWREKTTGAVWRGGACGGRNKAENWTRFHRHCFVFMMNETYVHSLELDAKVAGGSETCKPQPYTTYHQLIP